MKKLLVILLLIGITTGLNAQDYIGIAVCPSDIQFSEGNMDRCKRRALEFRNYHKSIPIDWKVTSELPNWYQLGKTEGTLGPGEYEWNFLSIFRDSLDDGVYRDTFYVHGTGPNYDWTKVVKLVATKNMPFTITGVEDSSSNRKSLTVHFNMPLLYHSRYMSLDNFTMNPDLTIKHITFQDTALQFIMKKKHKLDRIYTMNIGALKDVLERKTIKISFQYTFTDTGVTLIKNSLNKNAYTLNEFVEDKCDNRMPESFNYFAYPNPFIDRLHIQLNSLYTEDVNVELINVIGQSVYSVRHKINEGFNAFHLNVPHHLPSGLYFVKIETKLQMHRMKLFRIK